MTTIMITFNKKNVIKINYEVLNLFVRKVL